ncbi:MAG: glycyl-radical enzyme activating protein [Planctomycetaceae bacterium]|nr:glycyl-radical enzyme activating protein [Planctomycetaceae bacterium]
MIFNVQKCSIHDGNGLRTLVFFKGCPLKCKWCSNPESQAYGPEVMESQGKCIGCMACLDACPRSAIRIAADGPRIDRDRCTNCLKCTDRCYAASKYPVGAEYETEELYRQIDRDRDFYLINGGGVTFSGGEPLTHTQYLTEIARICHERGIDVAVESCGVGNFSEFKHALPYVSSMFLDIKHIDSAQHKAITGSGNELILHNIKRIAQSGVEVTIRTPIIPGLNDSTENLIGIAQFLRDIPEIREFELLAYHQLGANKYHALGRPYELEGLQPPADEAMRALVKCANDVFEGTETVCFYTKDNTREIIR